MATNLKNYTTDVPADRSILLTEQLLVKAGALNINKQYGPSGNVEAIMFLIKVGQDVLPFRLPAKVDEIYVWLKKRSPKSNDKLALAQAERITWKQTYEWVHLQLSMIELKQMEVLEAFFPRLWNYEKRETFYEQAKKSHFKALLNG